MEEKCNCPEPELCKQLKMHVAGRLYEIWTGVNIDPEMAEKYRELWRKRAATTPELRSQSTDGSKSGQKKKDCGCKKKN